MRHKNFLSKIVPDSRILFVDETQFGTISAFGTLTLIRCLKQRLYGSKNWKILNSDYDDVFLWSANSRNT